VHFVASDAHDVTRRPPGLRRAWDAIAARWGEEAARELLADNPGAVVANRPLPSLAPAGPGEADEPGKAAEMRAALRFTSLER